MISSASSAAGFYEKAADLELRRILPFRVLLRPVQGRQGRGLHDLPEQARHLPDRSLPARRLFGGCPRSARNYVCTEYGIVNLRGLSGYERAAALISIAHPDDREWLTKEAKENGLLAPKFPVSMLAQEGGTRRYPSYEERRNYKIPLHGEISGFDWDPHQSGEVIAQDPAAD